MQAGHVLIRVINRLARKGLAGNCTGALLVKYEKIKKSYQQD
jgi:hypothetical protein